MEAALIMPVIFGVVFLFYSLALIQFQNVSVRATAMRVANRTAMNWNTLGKEHTILDEDLKATVYAGDNSGKTGKTGENAITSENFSEHDPYRFFIELFTAGKAKEEKMNKYLEMKIEKGGIRNAGLVSNLLSADISGDSGLHIFNRYISVTINNAYQNPVLELLDGMGFPQKRQYRITAKAKLTEPADFVRNVSYVQELLREWKKKNK